ncbi:hypothetical protein PPERSA_00822 [Pseudocohnilembus persalinus]|uniref:Palmitoyltransferase n=1 Tax=Pseudocohnilembus persalinus TaxID=266149 RepID=A0A0V0QLU1_PSEPJ|nr:hypothetical protein PPERSA_00822 [Pseudocohnilembus persalinus]|eukprot:KRX03299.1 hypothetical protein PPERSA_00822 [Pseudocohnilembus persalinus]
MTEIMKENYCKQIQKQQRNSLLDSKRKQFLTKSQEDKSNFCHKKNTQGENQVQNDLKGFQLLLSQLNQEMSQNGNFKLKYSQSQQIKKFLGSLRNYSYMMNVCIYYQSDVSQSQQQWEYIQTLDYILQRFNFFSMDIIDECLLNLGDLSQQVQTGKNIVNIFQTIMNIIQWVSTLVNQQQQNNFCLKIVKIIGNVLIDEKERSSAILDNKYYVFPLMNNKYQYKHMGQNLPYIFYLVEIIEYFPLFIFNEKLSDSQKGINIFFITHIPLLLGILSFLKARYTKPGYASKEYSAQQEQTIHQGIVTRDPKVLKLIFGENYDQSKKLDAKDIVMTMTERGIFCKYCNLYTPPRSYHCNICNKCVLRHEYHLPVLSNCIGYNNLKFYIQGHFYFLITFILICLSYFKFFIESWVNKISVLSSLINSFVYIIILILVFIFTYFLTFHLKLVSKNFTSVEVLQNRKIKANSVYNFGTLYNFEQVFGKNKYLWFLPLKSKKSKGKGFWFKSQIDQNNNQQQQEQEKIVNQSLEELKKTN